MGCMGRHFILRRLHADPLFRLHRRFRPSWPMTLLTVVLLAAFVNLGRWQWHRGVDKQALWDQFEHAPAPALTLASAELRRHRTLRRVAFARTFEPAHQFLLDNRIHDGQPGYEVLTLGRAQRWAAHSRESRLGAIHGLSRSPCPMSP